MSGLLPDSYKKDIQMIAIIDYDAGNLTSVKRALDFLGLDSKITPDPKEIRSAERVIFPGVGHAASAMKNLTAHGLDKALKETFAAGTPVMGICLGTQIILSRSEEGDTECLGLIDGICPKFRLTDKNLKVPHIGWNSINIKRRHPVLDGIQSGEEFYFVHSFYPKPHSSGNVIAVSDYEIEFPAIIGDRNLVATQFHPEKSGPSGLRILSNFSKWDGRTC